VVGEGEVAVVEEGEITILQVPPTVHPAVMSTWVSLTVVVVTTMEATSGTDTKAPTRGLEKRAAAAGFPAV